MKVFIVFLALVLVFSMYLVYLQDMNSYIQDQKLLKMLAEDCAEAGALTIDERTERIDKSQAIKAASEILRSSRIFPKGSIAISSCRVTEDGRGFEVELTYKVVFFRLPFIEVSEMRRVSEYVWE